MHGGVELLKKMICIKKGGHGNNEELSSVVGGAEGSQAIPEMFRDSYSNLLNSAPSHHELTDLLAKLIFPKMTNHVMMLRK